MAKYKGRIILVLIIVATSLCFYNYNYFFDDYSEELYMSTIILFAFLGWRLGKRYDMAVHDSEKDALTDIYNRRYIMDAFPGLQNTADKRLEKLYIFLIDVDNFKSINDRLGHNIGDRILRQVARTLSSVVHRSGYVARWGGDEFLLIIPCTDESGMKLLQNHLQRTIHGCIDDKTVQVSCSFGHAVYPDEGEHLYDLISIADCRMYHHKKKLRHTTERITQTLIQLQSAKR
ncbi:GGDEF domain-containing protein [Paenibacillus profundus]|nr:GGDEF domain-containing protein [Paenibacillus profundus]